MDLLEDVQEIKKNKRKEQCHEKKPWRKPEADISDYFNYGFNEETWSAYCKKQAILKTFKRKRAKIMLSFSGRNTHLPLLLCWSGSMANSSAMIDTTKTWECYIRQEKRDKDRNRSREHGHDKESKRCRDREKRSSSSSHDRGEEQKKCKRSMVHEHKHLSGDKSQRDKSKGRQKTSQSSSSRKNDCEDRDKGCKHKGREKEERQREQQDELC
ncbi:uncharacterized protein fip1l1a [Odontesthes bonariensis]